MYFELLGGAMFAGKMSPYLCVATVVRHFSMSHLLCFCVIIPSIIDFVYHPCMCIVSENRSFAMTYRQCFSAVFSNFMEMELNYILRRHSSPHHVYSLAFCHAHRMCNLILLLISMLYHR